MRFKFTDKEITVLLKNLVVLIDTREQKTHIKEWLDKNKIKNKKQKLDYGDYSCFIQCNGDTNKIIDRDIYFDRDIAIERKKDIDELCGNLKEGAVRLKTELAHMNKYDIRFYIYVEDALMDKHIRDGKYRSLYDAKTLYARLKSIETEYDTVLRPVGKEYIAGEIYNTLKYFIRNKLKKSGIM